MFPTRRLSAIYTSIFLLFTPLALRSQTVRRAGLIHEVVDENKVVTFAGNVRPEATAENDLGAVSDDLPLDHMMLQLKRPPQLEQAVEQLIADLHDPQSPRFHQWLTAAEFGANYGLAQSDIQAITGWLESHGFVVNSVYPSGMLIDFSGNASQVRRAFHTSLHHLTVKGARHIANFSDPEIPEALASAVTGIISLTDFRPQRMSIPKYTYTQQNDTYHALVPDDLATIYDFTPLFTKGITGTGQTIVLIEDTDLFSSADWTAFRKTFGLAQYTSGSLVTEHPAPPKGANNCASPGVNPDDIEAALDVEWASAGAPGASIVLAACADTTSPTSGIMFAMQNLVNGSHPPAIISLSYGVCEVYNGAALNASINSLYQQAVAEGISVFVAAGDDGAAGCDGGQFSAEHGISVSGFASTPYNVAVGGTDFSDTVDGTAAKYWNATNTLTYGSALSYIPEIPWNNSCAGSVLAKHWGYSTSYGSEGFCISTKGLDYNTVAAASGGPSNCATGVPLTLGVASGSCQGYAKPAWQTGLSGIPKDGVRDVPDVSMFASNGFWGHYAIICYSDLDNGGATCNQTPSNWSGVGGTSLAAPVMAAVQALVNQHEGARQGNPNPVYYAMAVSSPKAFHPITRGDIDVNCDGPHNCFGFLGTVDYGRDGRLFGTTYGGVLSVSGTSLTRAYPAGGSWNFANGIGSVDAYNLVMNWGEK